MEGLFDVDFLATLHVDALHGVGYAATAEVVDGSVGVVEGLGGCDASGLAAKFEAEAVGGFTCHSVSGEEGAVLLERGAAGVVESYAIDSVAEYEEGGLFCFGDWETCGRTAEDVVGEVAGGCAGNEEQEVILFGVAHEDNALFGCDVFHLHGLGHIAFGVGHLVGFHVKSGVEGEVVGQEGGGIGVGAYGVEVYNEFFDGHEVPLGCGGRFAVFPAHDFAIGRLIVQVVVGVVRAVHVAEGEEAAIVRNFEAAGAFIEEHLCALRHVAEAEALGVELVVVALLFKLHDGASSAVGCCAVQSAPEGILTFAIEAAGHEGLAAGIDEAVVGVGVNVGGNHFCYSGALEEFTHVPYHIHVVVVGLEGCEPFKVEFHRLVIAEEGRSAECAIGRQFGMVCLEEGVGSEASYS